MTLTEAKKIIREYNSDIRKFEFREDHELYENARGIIYRKEKNPILWVKFLERGL